MQHLIMAENGRLVIPAALRQEINMSKGGKMIASVRDGTIVLEPMAVAVRRTQDRALQLKAAGESVVDHFIAERRAEAEGEHND